MSDLFARIAIEDATKEAFKRISTPLRNMSRINREVR